MKFLLTQLILLILSVIFVTYMFTLEYFTPFAGTDNINWYNMSLVLTLVFVITESFVSLVIFLVQKFLAYGWKEFPDYRISVKWGIISGLAMVGGVLLNAFNILIFPWGFLALLLVITLITII